MTDGFAKNAIVHQSKDQAAPSSQLDTWREKFAGAPPLLELPTDHPRPAVQSLRGAVYRFTLPQRLKAQLERVANQSATTLSVVLQAAFAILLYRYSSQEDILVGLPLANHDQSTVEPESRTFAAGLVLRANLANNPSFTAFLAQVQRNGLEAAQYSDLPFEQLVASLDPAQTRSYHPLFQVAFQWQQYPHDDLPKDLPKPAEPQVSPDALEQRATPFDLTISLHADEQTIQGEWVYSTDLFAAATIQRMTGHWQTLLESIVADPEQRIGTLPLLTVAERHQVLVTWNNTQSDYPRDKAIHQLFEEQVERTPNAIAVVFADQTLTYAELNRRANQLAHYLRSLGVGKQEASGSGAETLVGLALERSLEMLVGLLGILKAGGAYVPLDVAYPAERLAFMFEDSAISILLTQAKLSAAFPAHLTALCLDTAAEMLTTYPVENPHSAVYAEDLAYIMYTSGSTGRPKGVCITQRNVVRLVQNTNFVQLGPQEVFLQLAPISFDASTLEIWGALLNGGRLVVMPPQQPSRHLDSPVATK